jgi:hypothetical protein
MKDLPAELAPCGVYCRACPSFNKTCLGCPTESKEQKRTSKWGCKIRKCCYEDKKLDFCGYCSEFPCNKVNKKLIDSHPGDNRFKYRHEIPENFIKLKNLGIEKYKEFQKQQWKCPACGGIIQFYLYKCRNCSNEVSM